MDSNLIAFLMGKMKDSIQTLAVAHHLANAGPEAEALTKREVRKHEADSGIPYTEENHANMTEAAKRVVAGPHAMDVVWVDGNDLIFHGNFCSDEPYNILPRPADMSDEQWDCIVGWADYVAPYGKRTVEWYNERTVIAFAAANAATEFEAAAHTLKYQQAMERYIESADENVLYAENGIMGMAFDVDAMRTRGAVLRAAPAPAGPDPTPVNPGVLEA